MSFNHMFSIAFTVVSEDETGEDVTPLMLQTGLLKRMANLNECNEWLEATGAPDDTYEVQP